MRAEIRITLKDGVLDPQGAAISHALGSLGFEGVGDVRQGKLITLEIDAPDKASAEAQLTEMCEKLLANTVIERFDISV